MKKVIDANFFQDKDLEVYLSSDPDNFVVFTDFACMEAYKSNALSNIKNSLSIVSRYPNQVIVLKPTRDIIKIQHKTGIIRVINFEDSDQTEGFRQFCEYVRMADAGNRELTEQIQEHGREASSHFDLMLSDAQKIAEGIQQITTAVHPDHLRSLRNKEALSSEAAKETIHLILLLTDIFIKEHPDISVEWLDPSKLRDSYIFRYSIAAYLLAARWISEGGANNVRPEKLRNDVVDITYAAYASFYDGLLSRDKKLIQIYEQVMFLLNKVFVC